MKIKELKDELNNIVYLYFGIKFMFKGFSFKNYKDLKRDLSELNKQAEKSTLKFPVTKLYPCYKDKYENAATLNFHYLYQDWVVAQRVFKNNPVRHIDIGSQIDGFVTHIATFRSIEVYDILEYPEYHFQAS